MSETCEFDPIWEQKYSQGHSGCYPWDHVVSFVFKHYPKNKPRQETKILEVGCGTASNLWFAAREGFQVTGIDASPGAIDFATKRFSEEGLKGDFHVGSFTKLPFDDESFDITIDRAAITCCGFSSAEKTFDEIKRVLKCQGKFYFNPYSTQHSSFKSGIPEQDGLTINISAGTLVDTGQICFYSRQDIDRFFSQGWNLLSIQHIELTEKMEQNQSVHAEWRVIAEKN